MFLWEAEHWPALSWDASAISWPLARARVAQGFMLGRAAGLSADTVAALRVQAALNDPLAQAVTAHRGNVTEPEVLAWARALSPPLKGLRASEAEHWPAARELRAHLRLLLDWFNMHSRVREVDGLVRAALAHLWVETIGPFEDRNADVARALADLAVVQDVDGAARLWSLGPALDADPDVYRLQVEDAIAHPRLDVTEWVHWYLGRLAAAFDAASASMDKPATLARFWARVDAAHPGLAPSQRAALGRMLDGTAGLENGISTEKYVSLTGVSRATAYRELTELAERGVLERSGVGRATRYALPPGSTA